MRLLSVVSVSNTAHAGSGTAERGPIDRRRLAVVLVLLAAPIAAFPWGFVPKALLDGKDDLLENLPKLVYSGKKLLEGELLWTPELWMGHPLLGEPEFATLYLPKLLLLLGPPVVAYAVYLVLHVLMAEVGSYLYIRSLGVGRMAGVFGAVAYANAGFMFGHRAHTMYICAAAWTPLVLLLFDRATEWGGRWNHLGAALAFAMLPICGAVQFTVYLAGTIVLLAVSRTIFERRPDPLWGAASCLVPALLISAVQVTPAYHFSRQLATNMRENYALDVMYSFHPLLLPTLALPVAPLDGELYSRCGVSVLCAALVAIGGIRHAPPRVRAWAVVLAVSFVLMLGKYVPPIARLLHGLPIIGVLRGPARHNYEFAIASSILAARGFDAARQATEGPLARWIGAGAAFAAFTYGAVLLADRGGIADENAVVLMSAVTLRTAIVAALAFAVWVLAIAQRWRGVWATVMLLPLLETAWVTHVEVRPSRSALGQIETARAALPPEPRFVRLLSVGLLRGSAEDLTGNSVLFHRGVGSLQGYASIAYSAARDVLDLDMHGQPNGHYDLALSVLPSIFGVTHVVLPSVACGNVRFSLGDSPGLCARTPADAAGRPEGAIRLIGDRAGCTALMTDSTWRYDLNVRVRAPRASVLGASLVFVALPKWRRRFGLEIPGPLLGSEGARAVQPFRTSESESFGLLYFQNRSDEDVEFSEGRVSGEHDITVAAISSLAGSELRLDHADIRDGRILFAPDSGSASAERSVHWAPVDRPASGMALLEVDARAANGAVRDLVVDLHDGAGYDPDDAQLIVPGSELGTSYRVFRRAFRIDGAPDEFSLRASALGGAPIDVREVRLAASSHERVYDFPLEVDRYVRGSLVDSNRIVLEQDTEFGAGMHLPLRAFDVVLDAETESPRSGSVDFGFDAETRSERPRSWRLEGDALTGRVRAHRTAQLPPDLRDPSLFVRVDGLSPLRVNELSATDVCMLRGYENPRRLSNGLFLYENSRAAPRAYAVGRTVRAGDMASVRRALLDFSPSDVGHAAVVTRDVPRGLGSGIVEHSSFEGRRASVVVRSDGAPTLLVVNERFDPDWRATIDGGPAAMFPVNGFVRGVVVPAGRHVVRFEYRVPRAVWVGVGLAGLGVLFALFLAPRVRRGCR